MESQEPSERLQNYLDGTLSPAENEGLEERLKSEPLLADWLILLATEEAVLKGWAGTAGVARTSDLGEPWPANGGLIPHAPLSPSRSAAPPSPAAKSLRKRLILAGVVLVLVASLGALAVWKLGIWSFFFPRPEAYNMEPIAQLEDVYGDVLLTNYRGEDYPGRSDQSLSWYEKIRTGTPFGFASVRYPDNTRLELCPDSLIQLDKPVEGKGKHLWVGGACARPGPENGYLRVDVPMQPPDQPLILTTDHAEITVQAGRFTCACTAQTTRVEVEEGTVEMVRLVAEKPVAGELPVKLEAGSYAVAGKEAEALAAHRLTGRQLFEPRKVLSIPGGPVLCMAYSPDGERLASGCWDGVTWVWGPLTGKQLARLRPGLLEPPPVRCLAFFPRQALLAAGGDKEVHIWNLENDQEEPGLPPQLTPINALAVSPDGKSLATTTVRGDKASIKIWPWPASPDAPEIREHSATTPPVVFSPDSRLLAAGFQEGSIKVWEAATRKKQAGFSAPSGAILAVQFNPKGDLLASGGQDKEARIWRWKDGKLEQHLTGHGREVGTLAFSRDGRLLATGAADGTARLWEVSTGQLVATLKHGGYAVNAICFSPDGKTLATAGWNAPGNEPTGRQGAIKLWDVPEIPVE